MYFKGICVARMNDGLFIFFPQSYLQGTCKSGFHLWVSGFEQALMTGVAATALTQESTFSTNRVDIK